ncbi:unnamed protein product [Caenorhabditis auriculariae]|uniref:Protein-tyrosine-phosphatase n=1 Tax=Caenorhabditis auriculariae TaxID=2777116 RepID=A0A8S1GLY1_9PELO|nr:unnamed protein product [Caenorhabditis auriculariae]
MRVFSVITAMSRVGVLGQMSEINEHLYLSGAGVLKPDKMKQRRISFVVNATTEEPNAYLQGVDYLKIRIEDHPYARIQDYFDTVADKIKSVKEKGGRTLVHCMAGVSRSASLVMIYLVKYEHMTLRQAYLYVKAARPVVRPNIGFWKQMVDYEKRLRGTASVKMIMTTECDMPIPDVYCEDVRRLQQLREMREMRETARQPPPALSSKYRTLSASTFRPTSLSSPTTSSATTTRRAHSPALAPTSLALSTSRMFSPAPSRKPARQSVFSMYSAPRHTFFSAF